MMHQINLKALLLLSTSSSKTLRCHKRFQLGKLSFAVRYDLCNTQLIIKQVKCTRRRSKLAQRLRRRRRCLAQQGGKETADKMTSMSSRVSKVLDKQTMTITRSSDGLVDGSSQTATPLISDAQLDTVGLIKLRTRIQQTALRGVASGGSQTVAPSLETRATQSYSDSKTLTTQTEDSTSSGSCLGTQTENSTSSCLGTQTENCISSCLGTQTEQKSAIAGTQTNNDCQHSYAQTEELDEREEQDEAGRRRNEQVLYLILDSLRGHGELLHSGIDAINKLIDLNLLGMMVQRQEAGSGSIEDKELTSVAAVAAQPERIGDLLELPESKAQMELPQYAARRVKLRHRYSKAWHCTLKCKGCGLHMHRMRHSVSTDCQCTQTDADAKAGSSDMATQTDKERGFWTMRR